MSEEGRGQRRGKVGMERYYFGLQSWGSRGVEVDREVAREKPKG